jgi:hypothetical protein
MHWGGVNEFSPFLSLSVFLPASIREANILTRLYP